MLKRSQNIVLPLLLLAVLVRLPAQPYGFLHYTVADGLPQSEIHAALADSRGYLWLGTPGGGLSRFDGRNFVNFSMEDGLPSNVIQALHEDNAGQVWIGTATGLAVFDGRNFHTLPAEATPAPSITAFARQTDSSLWVGTNRGLYEYLAPSKKLQKVKKDILLDQLPIQALYPSGQRLWVATERGAWRLSDTLAHFDLQAGLPEENVSAFTRGPNGQLWVVTHNRGIAILNEAVMEVTGYRRPPALRKAFCAYTDPERRIWIGARDHGLFLYDPKEDRWQYITEENGLPNQNVQVVFSDPWGQTWVAMAGGGLAKYLGRRFPHFDRRNGLPDNRVYALAQDHRNRLWISAGNEGLTLYDKEHGFRPMNRDSGLIDVPARALLEDRRARMWVGTDGLGLFVFDSLDVRRYSTLEGLPANRITLLAEDSLGNIWAATPDNGLVRIITTERQAMRIDRMGLEGGMTDRGISALEAGPQNRVWFGTRQGELGYFERGRLAALYGRETGLPTAAIRSIAFDRQGRIWLGTAGQGIFFAETQGSPIQFKRLAPENTDLGSSNINLLIFDQEGQLWAGHDSGVDKILFNPAGTVAAIQSFGPNEGFLGLETYPGAALIDHEGYLWFGTVNGLLRHRPTEQIPEVSVPRIHFQSISLFYEPLEATAFADWAGPAGIRPGLTLPARENHLGFSFKGINLSAPESVRYRWRLKGLEKNWSPLSENESVYYSNLSPGSYAFEVQVCSGEDHCSEPIAAAFRIRKPLWQLPWFLITGGLFALALVFGIFRGRLRAIRRKEKSQREQLEMQNHLLQLEQKALQLQMNPHFIFNALNSIQSLVAAQDTRSARRQIQQFAGLMRRILSNARKQRISLREEIDTLEQYLRMEQFCQRVDFAYQITLPSDTDADDIEIPPMLIQPFVENAVIHGIAHLSGPGRIDIRFFLDEGLLTCEIEDNGVGRERAAALRIDKGPGHQSTAMQVNRERLETLLAGRPIKALEIIDLKNGNGQAAGTKVLMRIPVDSDSYSE